MTSKPIPGQGSSPFQRRSLQVRRYWRSSSGFFQSPPHNVHTGSDFASTSRLSGSDGIDRIVPPPRAYSTAASCRQSVFNAVLLFFEFRFSGGACLNNCYASSQLGSAPAAPDRSQKWSLRFSSDLIDPVLDAGTFAVHNTWYLPSLP